MTIIILRNSAAELLIEIFFINLLTTSFQHGNITHHDGLSPVKNEGDKMFNGLYQLVLSNVAHWGAAQIASQPPPEFNVFHY